MSVAGIRVVEFGTNHAIWLDIILSKKIERKYYPSGAVARWELRGWLELSTVWYSASERQIKLPSDKFDQARYKTRSGDNKCTVRPTDKSN